MKPLPALVTLGGLLMNTAMTPAQTFTTLYRFTALQGTDPYTNNDGAGPNGGLVLSGNVLYGTASRGGASGNGTVFRLNIDGTHFTNLHTFSATSSNAPSPNGDGADPKAGLTLSGNILYGTALEGGSSGYGVVYAVNCDGSGFTNLHSFTNASRDGTRPLAGLVFSDNAVYGTTTGTIPPSRPGGGDLFRGAGTIFKINTNGIAFTNLYNFTNYSGIFIVYTNSDGLEPRAGLILSNNRWYGTAYWGGRWGYGTLFAVNKDGTGFKTLHNFTALAYPSSTNSDGANPGGELVLLGDTLYGTAYSGGAWAKGTVFAIRTNGAGFVNLHSFSGGSEGANPSGGLALLGNTLYGTTYLGGSSSRGTVFAIDTGGDGFTILHSFASGGGRNPTGRLVLSGYTLYGTTAYVSLPFFFFGPVADPSANQSFDGSGTVYSLSFAPQLTIIPSGPDVVLTWPTNNGGFDYARFALQSTTNLFPSAVWATVSPEPVVINGQYTVTNPISGTQQFYRLSQ